MRNIRLVVPTSVSAACHYAAQIAGCSVQEAYGVILFTAISRMTEEQAADWVKTGLSLYRAALTANYAANRQKGS